MVNHLLPQQSQSERGEAAHQSTHLITALNTQFPLSALCIPLSLLLSSQESSSRPKNTHPSLFSIGSVSMGVYASGKIMNSRGGGEIYGSSWQDALCWLSQRRGEHRTELMEWLGWRVLNVTYHSHSYCMTTAGRKWWQNEGGMLNECRSEVGLLSALKIFNGCLNRDHSGREISFLETQRRRNVKQSLDKIPWWQMDEWIEKKLYLKIFQYSIFILTSEQVWVKNIIDIIQHR